jgi:hypothetical protein
MELSSKKTLEVLIKTYVELSQMMSRIKFNMRIPKANYIGDDLDEGIS